MRRDERNKLFIAGGIFAVVLATLLWQCVITIGQAIELTILFVLVLVTTIYAKRTAEIADATKQQAEEMLQPIVVPTVQSLDQVIGKRAEELVVLVENFGPGPALNIEVSATMKGCKIEKKGEGVTEITYGPEPDTERQYAYGPATTPRPLAANQCCEIRLAEQLDQPFVVHRAILEIKCYYTDVYRGGFVTTTKSRLLETTPGFVLTSTQTEKDRSK